MQDTILSLGKDSVKNFVEFMMQYIPKDTTIHSTSKVVNVFEKKKRAPAVEGGPGEAEEEKPVEEVPEDQLNSV
jgi:hypothetical protein